MRYMIKKLLCFTLIILSFVILPACTPSSLFRHLKFKNVIWQSEDNDYGIKLEYLVLQENSNHFGTIEFSDKKYDITVLWGYGGYDIYIVDFYGKIIDNTLHFGGGYDITEDDKVILDFSVDYVFDGALVGKP